MIVEDDAAQRVLYEMEISDMGYEVILARDGLKPWKIQPKTGCDYSGFNAAKHARWNCEVLASTPVCR
ncbi:MAG: hypothetical protein R3C26_06245 [Calditrichia bacterium]